VGVGPTHSNSGQDSKTETIRRDLVAHPNRCSGGENEATVISSALCGMREAVACGCRPRAFRTRSTLPERWRQGA
jgi:hypothetical protein